MATVADTFASGWKHHQEGRFQAAEQNYRQVIQWDPSHVDAWCFLGAACQAQGKLAEAESSLRRAVELMPGHPCAQNHLGIVLVQQGKLVEAVRNFQQFVLSQPGEADAFNNLGLAQAQLGLFDDAVASYQRALQLRPDYEAARGNLQQAMQRRKSAGAGVTVVMQAEAEEGPLHKAHAANVRGVACAHQGLYDQATAHFQEALDFQPDNAEAHNNLGIVQELQERHREAIDSYRQALRFNPNLAEAWNNMANALVRLDRFDDAIDAYRRAIQINPNYTEAFTHIGIVRLQQGKLEDALASYGQALRLAPNHADTRLYRSLILLLQGKWLQAWPDYECRWQTGAFPHYHFAQPRWDGSPLEGRTLLLVNEQGLGDTLQFVRYARVAQESGGNVVLRCQSSLAPLMGSAAGVDQLAPAGTVLPPFDVWAPLLSLPSILNTTVDTVPAEVPYVQADADLVAHWQREMDSLTGFKIGIAWQGNPAHRGDRWRSIPSTQFAQLAKQDGVELVTLQVGHGAEKVADLQQICPVTDLARRFDTASLSDAAAVMMNLDLVITVDSVVAHLAGALGVPVWVAVPLAPDWRWLLDREDNPWYPTMRLFRQRMHGDWDELFERMAASVTQLLGH